MVGPLRSYDNLKRSLTIYFFSPSFWAKRAGFFFCGKYCFLTSKNIHRQTLTYKKPLFFIAVVQGAGVKILFLYQVKFTYGSVISANTRPNIANTYITHLQTKYHNFQWIYLWYLSASGSLINFRTNHQENLENII